VAVGLRARLLSELERYLPEESVRSFASGEGLTPLVLADRAIRSLATRALEARQAAGAASRIRALPAIAGAAGARSTMPALERIGRATNAPAELVRPASQVAGALLRMESPGGEDAGSEQLLAAVVRLAAVSVRSGVAPEEVLRLLLEA
jgi:ClpP class serine protease